MVTHSGYLPHTTRIFPSGAKLCSRNGSGGRKEVKSLCTSPLVGLYSEGAYHKGYWFRNRKRLLVRERTATTILPNLLYLDIEWESEVVSLQPSQCALCCLSWSVERDERC